MRFLFAIKRNDDMLRMRIIANSDTKEDQATKLRVRDAVLSQAKQTSVCLDTMLATARVIDPTAQINRGVYHFGGYASDAIVITLGQGAGHNWWGILFPTSVSLSDDPVEFESFFMKLIRSWGWI